MRPTLILLSMALLSVTANAKADPGSAGFFRESCSTSQKDMRNYCLGAIAAIRQLVEAKQTEIVSCPPIDMTNEQLASVASRFVEDHPGTAYFRFAATVLVSWEGAFPCSSR